MKKFVLGAVASAIVVAFSGAAMAAVNLDTGAGAPSYATELVTNNVTTVTGAALNVVHSIDFGVSVGQTRYIRYQLANGVFVNAVEVGDFVGGLFFPPGNVTIAQGGGAGQNFVIFQVTAALDTPQNTGLGFDVGTAAGNPNIRFTNVPNSVTITYSLYEDAPSAAAGGTAGRLNINNNVARTLAGLTSGLTFTTTPNTTTAEVETEYKRFNNSTDAVPPATGTLAKIGNLTHVATAGVLRPADGLAVTIPDLLAAGTKVTITTDSNWAPVTLVGNVFLSNDVNCGASLIAATSRTANTTDIVVDANVSNGLGICYQANGAAPIEVQNFTIALTAVPAPTATTGNRGPIALGDFDRNGTILKAAFAEAATAGTGYSNAVHMTNLGAAAAPYAVRCLTNSGSVAGNPGSIPGNTAVRYGVTSTLGCPADGSLRGIEITLAVPEFRVIGSVVRQNTSTGQASFDNMIGSK